MRIRDMNPVLVERPNHFLEGFRISARVFSSNAASRERHAWRRAGPRTAVWLIGKAARANDWEIPKDSRQPGSHGKGSEDA